MWEWLVGIFIAQNVAAILDTGTWEEPDWENLGEDHVDVDLDLLGDLGGFMS